MNTDQLNALDLRISHDRRELPFTKKSDRAFRRDWVAQIRRDRRRNQFLGTSRSRKSK